MIEITLSDHVATQRDLAAQKRRQDYERALQAYHDTLAARQRHRDGLRQASRQALESRRLLAWLWSFWPRFTFALTAAPIRPGMAEAGHAEILWEAGSEGERRVSDVLGQMFSNDWILVSGYKNRRGELDRLLIGPEGLLAIEIKFVNGRVSCNGDRWSRDKYDRYGNLVETDLPIADRGGRGPSVQVNAVADRLQAYLWKRVGITRVARAVVLSHDLSEIGEIRRPTVDLIATLDQLRAPVIRNALSGGLNGKRPQDIVDLVRKDHAFHEQEARLRTGRKPPEIPDDQPAPSPSHPAEAKKLLLTQRNRSLPHGAQG